MPVYEFVCEDCGNMQGCNGNCVALWRVAEALLSPPETGSRPPPRGRPGEGPMDLPFRIEYLDAERLLPVLVRKVA